MAASFSSLEGFHSGFVKFRPQCFFQGNQRGYKTVADQKEYFVNFVFIVDMCRGITFSQHEKPHRGIVYKAVLIAEL